MHGNTRHGHSRQPTPTYKSWRAMRSRCTNSKHRYFNEYGGRGISVANEWQRFETFLAEMGERPDGQTLDRLDVNDHYYKENCRWATPIEQRNNRRDKRVYQEAA